MTQSQVSNPVTLTVNETANTSFAGTIRDAITDNYDYGSNVPGPLSLVKTGSATLTLSGTGTYTGGTSVTEGTLVVANSKAILDGSNLSVGNPTLLGMLPTSVVTGAVASAAPAAAPAAVPEPSSLLLVIAGICGMVVSGLRLLRRS
jgi:autotransporter-associated beta strand protein